MIRSTSILIPRFKTMFRLINFLLIGCLAGPAWGQVSGEKLDADYAAQRAAAILKLNQTAVQQADAIGKTALQRSDVAGATAAVEWSKRLSDTVPENDTEGLSSDPASREPLVALQTRYLKSRADALTQVSRVFLPQYEAWQKQAMQKNNLPEATRAAEKVAAIKEELNRGSVPGLGGGAAGDALFSANKQKKWTEKKGTWKWDGTKLTGSGTGAIEYEGSFQPPFVVQFRYRVNKGTRTRLDMAHVGLHNAAYAKKFGLMGTEEEHFFEYQHGTQYRCTIIVNRKQSILYVDGKQICTGVGEEGRIDKVVITSGDSWSPGEVEVQDLVVLRATNKVANP